MNQHNEENTTQADGYSYTAAFKLQLDASHILKLSKTSPGVTDVMFNSRVFNSYDDALISCKRLMTDFKEAADKATGKSYFRVNAEINPEFSGEPTISTDWEFEEIARMWLFDKRMTQTNKIDAIGRASIFSVDSPLRQISTN
jgi:hypothetical protein